MFRFLRRHRTLLMITLAFVMVGMLFFGIGGSSFFDSPQDVIAKVNGTPITRGEFDLTYNMAIRRNPDLPAEQRRQLTSDVFNEIIRQEVMAQQAEKYGLRVSDQELQVFLASLPAFQTNNQFDPNRYVQTVIQVFGMEPRKFEEKRRKDLAAQKLNALIAAAVRLPEDAVSEAISRRLALVEDRKERAALEKDPSSLRKEIRDQEVNRVFKDWLDQLNSKLNVTVLSDEFKKRLAGQG